MGGLETEVLQQLWAEGAASTPAEVLEGLDDKGLAYTTVMTILTRLWRKGLVERERRGRAYAYRAVISEADLAAQRMQATFNGVTDRSATLSRFVGSLDRKDERLLRRLLDDLDRPSR
jgi:predicted transcriptional regulator